MAVFPGTYIPIGVHSDARINHIIDDLLTPRLLTFRQIIINDEQAVNISSVWWKCTYPNWNESFPFIFIRNGGENITPATIDYISGRFSTSSVPTDGDWINVTYCFDWFSAGILAGYIYQVLDIINNSGQNVSPTSYTIDNAPANWNGVISDLTFAMCMEKLLLDYDLWYGRVIFAIGANDLNEGAGGDIAAQLETLKQNAEDRANISLQNEKFKVGNLLGLPTATYYAAVRGIGGARGYSKLKGWKPNKYI